MDRITQSMMDEFKVQENLQKASGSTIFEHFAAFSILSPRLHESLQIDAVAVGHDDTPGIDSLAIVVNGVIVQSVEEMDEVSKGGATLEVNFYFIQSKTSEKFEGAVINDFATAVEDFFEGDSIHASLLPGREVADRIFALGTRLKKNPTCHLYYATTGRWLDDAHLKSRISKAQERLSGTNLFSDVSFQPLGAGDLQQLYRQALSKTVVKFSFVNKVALPNIGGVEQSFLGSLPGREFLKIIRDDEGSLRKGIFEDNVRDFQGIENRVNQKIRNSIVESSDRFVVLNNGVTIVAQNATVLGNEVTLEDFQIVNGCQTSNVLFDAVDGNTEIFIPVRIVVTKDDKIANQITDATNSQSAVKSEDLFALLAFQRRLEEFFGTYDEDKKLYYERRSQQYRAISSVPRSRVVPRAQLVKSFASMFLNEPHRASRYYSTLYSVLGEKLFNENHKLESYYCAAWGLYRLEAAFRTEAVAAALKPTRYQLLHAVRHLALGTVKVHELNSHKLKARVDDFIDVLADQSSSDLMFAEAAAIVESALSGQQLDRDTLKQPALTSKITRLAAQARKKQAGQPWVIV